MKIKCDICYETHGGFHLCHGRKVNVKEEQYVLTRRGVHRETTLSESEAKAAAANKRWELHWTKNKERDQKILDRYNEIQSIRGVAREFGMGPGSIRAIIHRLGGSSEPSNT